MSAYPGRGLHGHIVRLVGLRIVSGELPPGAVIDLDALSKEADASKTVLREALRVIAAKGMVNPRQKRGTVVQPRDRWDLLDTDVIGWRRESRRDIARLHEDLAELRLIIEPRTAGLAAERRTDDDLAALESALVRMRRAGHDVEDIVDADRDFHVALLHASHNELLVRFDAVVTHAVDIRDRLAQSMEPWTGPTTQHEEILEAVRRRDGATAAALMASVLAATYAARPEQLQTVLR